VLLTLALGAIFAALMALVAGPARQAEATFPGANGKIVFVSQRTTGTGVDNPTGDSEVFTVNPDGTGLKQLTFNTGDDREPVLSPDGRKVAYTSQGDSTTNPGGDYEVYVVNAADGSDKKNLTNNTSVNDSTPAFSPDGTKIAYESAGIQTSNPEGDNEVYVMNALDGSGQKNLSNNGVGVREYGAVFSPDSKKIAYTSYGEQTSNLQGDSEVYIVNALDGSGQKNLTNNGAGISDYGAVFSPGGQKIAYTSSGVQTSNSQGDDEVYVMSALDGSGKKNFSNNGGGIYDYVPAFSPDGTKIAYTSSGVQTSNTQGDREIYRMSALDGSGKRNLSNNGSSVNDSSPTFSPDSKKVAYLSSGKQTSNPEGDYEVYRMNTLDGLGKKNLSNDAGYDYYTDWGVQGM
jgi:Tol biopolymer transport system component